MLLAPFLRQIREQPDALALAEGDRTLSYGELLARAEAVAGLLTRMGVGPGQRVAICLDRGMAAVAAIFGTLLAGACYVPLDLKNPPSRLAFIVRDAELAAILGKGEAPDWLEGMAWLDIAAADTSFAAHDDSLPAAVTSRPGHLAAILYTSGSTGQPKGVALSHGAVAAFARWAAELVGLKPEDRIASSAPFFFDLSTFDLYAVLGSGASLHFVPSGLTFAPARLSGWLRTQVISGWYTVPSLLAFLAYKGNLAQTSLSALRFLIFAGEVFPAPALMDLAKALPQVVLYNFFGPTETNVCCYWAVKRGRLQADSPIPIGMPAAGDELLIREDTGELWVRGPTVASGYWGGGSLQSFLNSEGWYATGDRVSRDSSGEYRFHGRLGRTLKCSGYRVEPAEIEAAVQRIAGVKGCAVVGVEDPTAGQRPALALSLHHSSTLAEVKRELNQALPAYMQPSRWLQVDELPQLSNGKTDYAKIRHLLEVP